MVVTGRYVFVHNPKAAGMSVTAVLGGKSPGYATHTPLHIVPKGDRFAFGIIRDPWSRLVSLYRFMAQKRMRETDAFDQEMIRSAGFRAWLMDPAHEFYMQEDTEWRTDDLPPMQRRPQLWWLRGADAIGRFERLPEDFNRICRMMDMAPPRLGHVNRTNGGDWRGEYDAESRAFVAEHFAPDIERFGYRFGP